MPYGKLITRFTTGGHDIFITCPAKSMHLEPFGLRALGLEVHAFCGTGDENIISTCRSAGNYYISIIHFFDSQKSKNQLIFGYPKMYFRISINRFLDIQK